MHFEAQISKLPLGLRTAATRPMPPVLANSPSSPGTVGDPKVRSSGDARSRLGRELIVKDEKGLKVQERSTTVQPKAPNASNPSTHLLIEVRCVTATYFHLRIVVLKTNSFPRVFILGI